MLKKVLLTGIILLLGQIILAQTIPVQIKPAEKITTANCNLQEGDFVNFVVKDDVFLNSKLYLKKDEPVIGVITSLKQNNFLYVPASLYMENFVTKNTLGQRVKLDGIVYKKGEDYWMFTQFIPFPCFTLKGGNAKMRPNKDVFTLFLEDKNE